MQFIELTAPSVWADYLFYGETSALSIGEEHNIDAWLIVNGVWDPVDCEDAGFIRRHDAEGYALAADCQRYVFRIAEE